MIYVQVPLGYKPPILTIEEVADLVCEHWDVSIHALKGQSRRRTVVDARHVISYLCCKNTRASLADIGLYLGGRDHTTVMHGRNKIKDLLDARDPIAERVLFLQRCIEQGTNKYQELFKAA